MCVNVCVCPCVRVLMCMYVYVCIKERLFVNVYKYVCMCEQPFYKMERDKELFLHLQENHTNFKGGKEHER